jgi:hypothetical protein
MPAMSYAAYTRLLISTPGTAEEIAERMGLDRTSTARLLSSFYRLGLCYPGGVRRVKIHANKTAVWMMGSSEPAEGVRVKPAGKVKAQHIAFANLWRSLEGGATAHGMAHEAGAANSSAYKVLGVLREASMVHIFDWEKDAMGRHVAVWLLGPGRDKLKPRKLSRERTKAYRDRLRIRMLASVWGPAVARMEAA